MNARYSILSGLAALGCSLSSIASIPRPSPKAQKIMGGIIILGAMATMPVSMACGGLVGAGAACATGMGATVALGVYACVRRCCN